MSRVLFLLCVIYGALVMQSNLLSAPLDESWPIWLPGLALASCMVSAESTTAIVCAALLGLGVDGLDQNQLGIHTVFTTLIATAFVLFNGNRDASGLVSVSLTIFVSTFCWRAGSTGIHAYLDHRTLDLAAVVTAPAIEAAVTGIFGGVMVLFNNLPRTIRQPHRPKSVSLANRWTMLTWG